MYDWFHIPIPIWIQVEQIFGVVRLRVQFIPEPPFVRNVSPHFLYAHASADLNWSGHFRPRRCPRR